jgi:TatD DNase family protein
VSPPPQWCDSHCHLEYHDDDDRAAEAVADASAAGVARLVTVGTDAARSADAIAVAARFPEVWATVGVHPHEASGGVDGILPLLSEAKVVAVGECGLDYYYDHSPRDAQRAAFAAQVALAHKHRLALVIHTRDAWDDTFDVLAAEGTPDRTVFHCFTGGPEEARRALDTGAFLSFSGIVSFPAAAAVRAAAVLCPADRLLVETDSPYLAPVPHRGKRNRPAWVTAVGAAVAAARGEPLPDVAACTFVNAAVAFSLPSP